MNTYVCFYKSNKLVIKSDTTYHAQQEAAKQLKIADKYRYQISVHKADNDGERCVIDPCSLPGA